MSIIIKYFIEKKQKKKENYKSREIFPSLVLFYLYSPYNPSADLLSRMKIENEWFSLLKEILIMFYDIGWGGNWEKIF